MGVSLTEYLIRGFLIEKQEIIKAYRSCSDDSEEHYSFEELYEDNPYENEFEKGRCFSIFDGMSCKYLVFGEIINKFNYNSCKDYVVNLSEKLWTLDDSKILDSFLEYSSKYPAFSKALDSDSLHIKTIFLRHFH